MRSMRRRTKEPWFGPKRSLGWGWTPVSWQGWVVTLLFLGLIVTASLAVRSVPLKTAVILALLALLLIVAVVTGDPPGGP